jgi:uncharacterized membrane protein
MPALQPDTVGPVDIAVITFDEDKLDADVAPALTELQADGTVSIIDLAFVRKNADGSTGIIEVSDDSVAADFGAIAESPVDLLSDTDLQDIAGALAPQSVAMVVVWENTWAAKFATAIRNSHGSVAVLERIPHDDVVRAIGALS